jgi:hypothetical protein
MARLFSLTVLLGAFLLFQVQPLLSKWILPWFGGGAAVWTTCMVFFQSILFAGYAFAHFSERHAPRPLALVLQLGLVAAAALSLPVGPGEAWRRSDPGNPALSILILLAVHAGLPCFVLSSTGPLVQSWFARACPGRSPYRLYALSNAGSLAALLTYPVLFEPFFGLKRQSALWTGAFAVFLALYAAGAVSARRLAPVRAADASGDPGPSAGRVALWIALPAFASWMLLASTNQLCQDLAVIPFLWVLPLAAYLMSFIAAFDHPRWYRPAIVATLTMILVLATVTLVKASATMSLFCGLAAGLGSLFVICLFCHGELARLKPSPRHLTGYYLALSGGGALGGIFVSLAAPKLFSFFWEWNLGMAIAYAAAGGKLLWIFREAIRAHKYTATLFISPAAAGLIIVGLCSEAWRVPVERARTYYGVVTIREYPGQPPSVRPCRDMVNGFILHGRQFLNEEDRAKPTTYYVEESGIGTALGFFREREDLRVGVVGLGVGTIAAYGRLPTQSFRFYEINPEVIRLSRKHFTFLGDCRGRVEVVPGDARLSLEREPPQRFHVLALDAFSGDTIPTHLLTAEAMSIYLRHLEPEGVLAFHVSNRCLDLPPVVRGLARRHGLKAVVLEYTAGDEDIGESCTWVLCSREGAGEGGGREVLWTDDRTDLLSVLKWR